MKLTKTLLAATIAVTSIAITACSSVKPDPDGARNGWIYVGNYMDGDRILVKNLSKVGRYRPYFHKTMTSSGEPKLFEEWMADCKTGQIKQRLNIYESNARYGDWTQIMPNTIGDTMLNVVCR